MTRRPEIIGGDAAQRAAITADKPLLRRLTDAGVTQLRLGDDSPVAPETEVVPLDPATAADLVHDHPRLATLAAFPMLSPGLATTVAGPDAWDDLLASGLPLVRRRDHWYAIPADAAELLRRSGRPDPGALRAGADYLAQRGAVRAAVHLLHEAGDNAAVNRLLAQRHWSDLITLDKQELAVLVTAIPDAEVTREPRGLLAAIRACDLALEYDARTAWLHRLDALLPSGHEVRADVDAELVRDLARAGRYDEALAAANAADVPEDSVAWARLQMSLAMGLGMHADLDPAATRPRLNQALSLLKLRGERLWEAEVWLAHALAADVPAGDAELAVTHLRRALALLPPGSFPHTRVQTFLIEALMLTGADAELDAVLDEASKAAARLGDEMLRAYVAWSQAWVANSRRDLTLARRCLMLAQSSRGTWYAQPAGVAFHCEAAVIMATMGDREAAQRHLATACAHPAASALPHEFVLPEVILAVRYDDPAAAGSQLDRLPAAGVPHWRELLLRAWAAHRRGDAALAADTAAQASREIAALPAPPEAAAREPELVAWAGALIEEPAEPTASAPVSSHQVRLFGALGVGQSGAAEAALLRPSRGRERDLLAWVALRSNTARPLPANTVFSAWWPGEPSAVCRRRLRNTLNRLRTSVGTVVERDGDLLRLAPGVSTDLDAFWHAAQDGRESLRGCEAALRCLAGTLLPEGPDQDWCHDARGAVLARLESTVDRLVDAAVRSGDLAGAARMLEALFAADLGTAHQRVRLTELLDATGQRAEARRAAQLAIAELAELGVAPPAHVLRLG